MLAKQNSTTFTQATTKNTKNKTQNTNLIAFVSYFETFDEFMHRKVKILMAEQRAKVRGVCARVRCFLNSVSYGI